MDDLILRDAERARSFVVSARTRWDGWLETFCGGCIARESCSRRRDVIEHEQRKPDYYGRYPLTDGDGSL